MPSQRPSDEQRLRDMLAAAVKVRQFTEGMTREAFGDDERTQYAVVALLEIVGEAAAKLPADFRQTHPQIPWRQLIGLRNHLIHGYALVDLDILWSTIVEDLDTLIDALTALLPTDPH